MPEAAAAQTPFQRAAAVIEEWLDGPGAVFATRTKQTNSRLKAASWDIELDHPLVGRQRASIFITSDFPARPPQVRFNKRLCLVLPHIEEDGKFCHGVEPDPRDYDDPVDAVRTVIEQLNVFWAKSADPAWVAREFHRESLSYWQRFCAQYKPLNGAAGASQVRGALCKLDGPTAGRFSAYFKKGQRARSDMLVAAPGEASPHGLAVRHGWAVGTMVRGHAMFVPMDGNRSWTPATWPRTLQELEALVAAATDHTQSISKWIEDNKDESRHAFLVVLAHGQTCYGYLIYPGPVARLTLPSIVPVSIERVDADWALARDHQLDTLHLRRKKKVLVLGCGSLGAPVAELLARAGVGELHLLDMEAFHAENCSRHSLGASEIGEGKAGSLALRLRKLVPGLTVKAHHALATDWVRQKCRPGMFDLVVDCTGEGPVRVALAHLRKGHLGDALVAHAWVEHFCAAAHVVLLHPAENWPLDNPSEKVNVATWMGNTRVELPACNAGFHPYGAADVIQAAGFTTERLLAALDGKSPASTVWSWVRSTAYFQSLGVDAQPGPLVPVSGSTFDATHLTRTYKEVFGDG